ncbi:MAG: hypothetical protein KJZ47_08670 [Gemmatimonadales bacterium]|nr:hypothetical protein [Gemmatimonadales bacterium]
MSIFSAPRFAPILLGGALLSGCSAVEPTDSDLPALAVRIEAPAQFRTWFEQTEACSGLTAAFEAVDWYVVPGVDQFEADGAPRVGMWQRDGDRSQIVVAGNYQNHEMVVSHEILHHLMGRQGHPDQMFVERCQLTWESWNSRTAGGASSGS